jgi:hypothetical protein
MIATLAALAMAGCTAAPVPQDTTNSPIPVTAEAKSADAASTGSVTIAEPAAPAPAATTPPTAAQALNGNPGYQTFLNLKIGASKEEVEAIMGTGTKMETDTFSGAGVEKYEYTKDGQVCWLSFRDGGLISKSTKEITDWSTEISKDTFAKIKNDMPLQEITSLIGEGQMLNEDHLYEQSLGEISKTYFWNVKTGYQSVTLMFKNDKVSYVSDMNMD